MRQRPLITPSIERSAPAGPAAPAPIPSHLYLHSPVLDYWTHQEERYNEQTRRVPSRIDQLANQLRTLKLRQGDALVAKVKECFHHGLGVKWGDNQIKIFNAFLAACLPFIYGESWPEEKARVFREWGLERERMYCLVNMARRNGKTFVTAGTTAALLLCVPNMKIAIFSTCKRTSQMMLTAATDMIEKAFELGTHADRQDFTVVTKNMESIIFEGPDRTKRQLGSFPGSVRVSRTGPKGPILLWRRGGGSALVARNNLMDFGPYA